MRTDVTSDRGMFFIARSSFFIFSKWVLRRTAFIQAVSNVWITRSVGLNTPKVPEMTSISQTLFR